MSFSSSAKREMLKITPEASCCLKAEAYGFLLFAKSFSLSSITIWTEREQLAHTAAERIAAETGTFVEIVTPTARTKRMSSYYTVTVPRAAQRRQVLEHFGHTGQELNLRIGHRNIEHECCAQAFLRSAFLSCGTVSDPNKEYHMEFVVPLLKLSEDLENLILSVTGGETAPKRIMRKGAHILYLKESEQIVDVLTRMGAVQASMEIMQVKMYKELRNRVNRVNNCETYNIEKTAAAAAEQRAAILRIAQSEGLESLPDDLRELAVLRLDNPDMSLRELGENLSSPISRSGVNHRLKRLINWKN